MFPVFRYSRSLTISRNWDIQNQWLWCNVPEAGTIFRLESFGYAQIGMKNDPMNNVGSLVGALEHEFIFPHGNNHPNWLIFFRGVETTNQLMLVMFYKLACYICFKKMSMEDVPPNCFSQGASISARDGFQQDECGRNSVKTSWFRSIWGGS